jgi:predicted SAM-dependent methyltransferase
MSKLKRYLNINTLKGLKKDIKQAITLFYIIRRRSLINEYYLKNKIIKLSLGSNISTNQDWLCSDIVPASKNCIYLDATKSFPFKDKSVDYIHSEHMIEHLTWSDGMKMLKESYRVLKPGGKIRIATPDLSVIINLYDKSNDLNKRYIQWSTDKFINGINYYHSCFVINNFFRDWNHQFIYDETMLVMALTNAGFTEIKKVNYNQSEDSNLRDMEQHGINVGNIQMVEFETMIFEALKPINE